MSFVISCTASLHPLPFVLPLSIHPVMVLLPSYHLQTSDAYVLFYCCHDKSGAMLKTFPELSQDRKRQKIQKSDHDENETGCGEDDETKKQEDMEEEKKHVNSNENVSGEN